MKNSEIERLYKTYGFIIYGRCRRILLDEEDARDAMQAVFMKLIEAYDSITDREKVVPWIFRVAQNHCFNMLRSRKRVVESVDADMVQSGVDENRLHTDRDLVTRVMVYYKKDVADAVYYTFAEGFDQREINRLTGQSPATIRRNLKKFREQLPGILNRLNINDLRKI